MVTESVVGVVVEPANDDGLLAEDPGIAGAAGTTVFTLLPATLSVTGSTEKL
ncbi:unannotated protein [freshwater metagenome]|uniref:Unannotated protein n=1 Tax=freshwater metagenome TaxID=449393 RepID=A0A6J6FLB0_9ZZZZ